MGSKDGKICSFLNFFSIFRVTKAFVGVLGLQDMYFFLIFVDFLIYEGIYKGWGLAKFVVFYFFFGFLSYEGIYCAGGHFDPPQGT